ncbi:EcoAI/FtnUII family type I restriction enzme subunit R [Frigoribacterium sp. ME-P-080]|uniref:EcoAI/FtnUII family type I restriction enzme subunit R n=1 Tax=Frigoribacterium sp. ME-P-080 TaxID=3040289 RepID=UPI00254F9D80|nr:DEAD/DEAH box helicase family protein [Frigoribacterium sp. ME-P-080]
MSVFDRGPLESETIASLVRPALKAAGWREDQILPEYAIKASRQVALGTSVRALHREFADFVLEATPGTPVAVVEAKREYRTADDAMQQAIKYAVKVDALLAYGTNGTDIIQHNLRTGQERRVDGYLPPAATWAEYIAANELDDAGAELIAMPFNRGRTTITGDIVRPRPYQVQAINRVLSAIARGDDRALLLMATGTGKTFTAMQIVAKLRAYAAVAKANANFRVLYLADRDALLTQPMRKDFRPAFGPDPVHRVLGGTDLSRELYFASYQSLTGQSEGAVLLGFPQDFFDLVIVDECHRGSAEENSRWRAVLDRFAGAVQLGLTATPRDDRVQSYEYFGNPLFEYSLRDGIEDGYLAPYRVRRVALTPDAEGWQPTPGERDRFAREIPDDMYETRDFERLVSLLPRTRLAARHLSRLLRAHPYPRAIVFCVDTEHASEMRRALIAANADRMTVDPEWVVRIVGSEGEKARLLDDLCDPTRSSPAIATTSRLLATGVDVEDLTHVVLFRPVGSMIEFKQIIGRGTRLYPEKGKTEFEIIDYVGASVKFNDSKFDGFPVHITVEYIDDEGEVIDSTDEPVGAEQIDGWNELPTGDPYVHVPSPGFDVEPGPGVVSRMREKYYVDNADFDVESETVLVPDVSSGELRLTDYGAYVRDRVRALGDAETVRSEWAHAESRERLRAGLVDSGVDLDEIVVTTGVPGIDPLDALHHLAWNLPTRTRSERARRVREAHDTELRGLEATARALLEGLLQRYEEHGIADLETTQVFKLEPLSAFSVGELAQAVGGAAGLRDQLRLVQEWLYAA